jgi:Domain of unknown function (DUF4382)
MNRIMLRRTIGTSLLVGIAATLAACGGGSGSGSSGMGANTGSVPVMVSDASSDDWATIGVRVLSIALVPQGGGSAVTVWTAPAQAPYVNLEQLDQIAEILGNATVPVGTYTGASLTLSANPGDVMLTVSADPESGFPVAAGTTIASNLIQIQGKHGSSGNYTVPLQVGFDSPLTVTTGSNDALDLEFDLAHPAFIVGHTPPAADGATLWAVNFDGPVRPHRVHDLARLVLRHTYGTVSSVAADNTSITITKDFPTFPVVNPETAIASSLSLQILADATNGTIFYDVDAKTRNVIKDFSSVAQTLDGKYVRIAARYQENGTLVAVRVWASTAFNKVWLSPEGHVLHVNATTDIVTVDNESGVGVPVTVDANTQFFFRTPADALADATPIGTGTGFLTAEDLVRGFKVHVSVVDPLATPLVAQTIDIETAAYAGRISAANTSDFTYTRQFATASDDYSVTLDYINSGSANGVDDNGNPIEGFKWWNFTYPTLLTNGSDAIAQFVAATNGGVSFGGSVGDLTGWGVSAARWADMSNPTGWSLSDAVLMPTPVPLGTVSTAFAGNSFAMSVVGGTSAAIVDVSTTAGSATLAYQVDRSNGVITVSPIDITTSNGLAAITSGLSTGALVKVYGVPQAGSLKAYVIVYFTGTAPMSVTGS